MFYKHTLQCYSALKKKELLSRATTWMNLEDITLSETSQTQENSIVCFQLHEVPRLGRFIEWKAARRLPGAGGGGDDLVDTESPFSKMERTMWMEGGDSRTAL